MIVYIVFHGVIASICLIGLVRSWRALKIYPSSIDFARWPISLLIVLMIGSVATFIDLAFYDFLSPSALNIIAAVELLYSAVVAFMSANYLKRVTW